MPCEYPFLSSTVEGPSEHSTVPCRTNATLVCRTLPSVRSPREYPPSTGRRPLAVPSRWVRPYAAGIPGLHYPPARPPLYRRVRCDTTRSGEDPETSQGSAAVAQCGSVCVGGVCVGGGGGGGGAVTTGLGEPAGVGECGAVRRRGRCSTQQACHATVKDATCNVNHATPPWRNVRQSLQPATTTMHNPRAVRRATRL